MSGPYRDIPKKPSPHLFYAETKYINLDDIMEMWKYSSGKWGLFLRGNHETSELAEDMGQRVFDALRMLHGQ